MTKRDGTIGPPEAADTSDLEEIPDALPVDSSSAARWEAVPHAEEIPDALPIDKPTERSCESAPPAVGSAKLGKCRHCGFGPVAQNDSYCPHCHGKFPNPSPFTKSCDWGVKIGGVLGVIAGIIWGLSMGNAVYVVIGLLLGLLGGLVLGLTGGMTWGIAASIYSAFARKTDQ